MTTLYDPDLSPLRPGNPPAGGTPLKAGWSIPPRSPGAPGMPLEAGAAGLGPYPASAPTPFWQRPRVQTLLPWATSLGLHGSLLLLALLLLPSIVRVASDTSKEQIIVPDATLSADGRAGGIPNPGLGNDPTRQAAQENDPTANDSRGWAQRQSDNLSQTLKSSELDWTSSPNHATGQLASLMGVSGGDSAAFGPRGGGGGLYPKSRIFGHGGNAYKIIYICDGSGSLIGNKEYVLQAELKSAVTHLSPRQAFNVVFFQENPGDSHFLSLGPQLMTANPMNADRLIDFLDKKFTFHGSTNPIPALREAFSEQPQLIYLLTDGEFDDPSGPEVLAEINRLNADKKVHVNTILLLGTRAEEEMNKDFRALMTQIAEQNGGKFEEYYSDDF
jgi:VWA domain-containing protein